MTPLELSVSDATKWNSPLESSIDVSFILLESSIMMLILEASIMFVTYNHQWFVLKHVTIKMTTPSSSVSEASSLLMTLESSFTIVIGL